jgi:hypothetical protein
LKTMTSRIFTRWYYYDHQSSGAVARSLVLMFSTTLPRRWAWGLGRVWLPRLKLVPRLGVGAIGAGAQTRQ